MTRGERVIAFIERYLSIPEGRHVGKPIRLMEFQKRFILAIYDNPAGTSRAYLSVGRKNGKTVLIACIALAHLVGPEARMNSQIISGAKSRDQAALVFKQMQKMVAMSPELRSKSVTRVTPSEKKITGVRMNVEYKAISAEAGTAHGLSPALAILDEVGQVKGQQDDFVDAVVTSQGAYDDPLLIAISTQAATDNDLFSRWLDYAATNVEPTIVSHVYTAPKECSVLDKEAWLAANPAMGEFRSLRDLEEMAQRADRLIAEEPSFRWLFLNQRIDATSPFLSPSLWKSCGADVAPLQDGAPVFAGLDLSEVNDLTALVLVSPVSVGLLAPVEIDWHVHPTFWLPEYSRTDDGNGGWVLVPSLADRSKADRVPYDIWAKSGYLTPTPGTSVDYAFVAAHLFALSQRYDLRKVAFDRYNFRHLKPWLLQAGFTEDQIEGDNAIFVPFGQGFASMSPALRDLEAVALSGRLVHGGHPVLTMCAANAVVQTDPAGNRKLAKNKSRGRIDGMVALAMAMSVAGTWVPESKATKSFWEVA